MSPHKKYLAGRDHIRYGIRYRDNAWAPRRLPIRPDVSIGMRARIDDRLQDYFATLYLVSA